MPLNGTHPPKNPPDPFHDFVRQVWECEMVDRQLHTSQESNSDYEVANWIYWRKSAHDFNEYYGDFYNVEAITPKEL